MFILSEPGNDMVKWVHYLSNDVPAKSKYRHKTIFFFKQKLMVTERFLLIGGEWNTGSYLQFSNLFLISDYDIIISYAWKRQDIKDCCHIGIITDSLRILKERTQMSITSSLIFPMTGTQWDSTLSGQPFQCISMDSVVAPAPGWIAGPSVPQPTILISFNSKTFEMV